MCSMLYTKGRHRHGFSTTTFPSAPAETIVEALGTRHKCIHIHQ